MAQAEHRSIAPLTGPDDPRRFTDSGIEVAPRYTAADLPGDLDSHRDVSVRAALAPLARLAQQHDVAILAVAHLTKGSRDTPALRAQGSVAFTAAVRTQLLLGRDPQEGESSPIRHVVVVKSNIGPEGLGLKFTVEGGRFEWLGASTVTGRELAARHGDPEGAESGALAEAVDVLAAVLADAPVSATEARRECREAGISDRTTDRAKAALGVKAVKAGLRGGWVWRLPDPPQDAEVRQDEPKGAKQTHWRSSGDVGTLREPEPIPADPDGAMDPLPLAALASGPDGAGWRP